MKASLRDLWRGNICAAEQCGSSRDLWRAEHLAAADRDRLTEGMSDAQRDLLEQYTDHMYSVSTDYAEDAFVQGVSLGMRLAFEAMSQ